jgi:DNA-binding GntR family transcriptional regulator
MTELSSRIARGSLAEKGALVDRLVETLTEQLSSGTVPPGAWLRQATLAREFQVSRTPVRYALQQLHAQGLVEIVPNQGAFVRGPTAREIQEAYLVRAELEGVAAELASGLISVDQLRRLREAEALFERGVHQLIQRRTSSNNPGRPSKDAHKETWVTANDLFHDVVQEASCNERLRQVIGALHHTFPRNLTWSVLNNDLRLLQENVEHHSRIRAAIEHGDGVEARQMMVAHVKRSGDLIAKRMGPQAQRRTLPR